jgi:hypothetical protein
MAAPCSHIHYALGWFGDPAWAPSEQRAFVRGAMFPDIRYLGKVARSSTHRRDITAEAVRAEQQPFARGFLAHSYVDLQQKQYFDGLALEKKSEYVTRSALKFAEDTLVYPLRNDWLALAEQFTGEPLPEELAITTAEDIRQWSADLRVYLLASPSRDSAEVFLATKPLAQDIRQSILDQLNAYLAQPKMLNELAVFVAKWGEAGTGQLS